LFAYSQEFLGTVEEAMKRFFVLLLILTSMIFVSCATRFDRALLRPTPNEINPKIPNIALKSADSDFSVGRQDSKSLSTNSYLYTIFERECENNLIEWNSDDQWGTIDLVLIDASYDPVDAFSLSTSIYVEFELRIYDIHDKKIWSKAYYKEGGSIIAWTYAQVETDAQTKIIKTFGSFRVV
jgi:hypothetical protein